MKKILSFVLCVIFAFTCFNTVFAAEKIYDLSGDLPVGDEANYKPYTIALNATRYTPWYVQYARSTKSAYEKGIRAGDGNQRLMSIGISPVNPDHMLTGSDKSGIIRSDDGGINWEFVGNNSNGWACTDIEWSPVDENVVFVMQTGNVSASSNALGKAKNTTLHGIYKSKDAGKTWYQVLSATCLSNGNTTNAIEIMPSGNIYVLTSEGIFKSTDEGESFEKLSDVITENSLIGGLHVFEDEKTILAAGGGGVYLSTSKGYFWKNITSNVESTLATCVTVDPDDDNHWYGCFQGMTGKSLFETYDKGESWTEIKVPNNNTNKKAVQVLSFAKDEKGNKVMIITYQQWGSVYRYSIDNGKTWKGPTFDRVDEDIYNLTNGYVTEGIAVCETKPNLVYYSFGDQVYKSVDGGKTYRWSNSGFSGINNNCVFFDKSNHIWFADADRGVAVTDTPYVPNSGVYPTVSRKGPEGTADAVAVDPDNQNHVFASIESKFYESSDRGETWSVVEGVVPSNFIKYHNKKSKLIYTKGSTSKDGGDTWVENTMKITAVSNVNNDVLYSYNDKEETLYQSKDRGQTWNKFFSGVKASYVFYPDEFDENTIWYAGYNGNIYKVISGVQTVFGKENGIKYDKGVVSIDAIAQNPKDKNHIIAGGKNTMKGVKAPGLYETYDGGESWHIVPGGKSSFTVGYLRFSPLADEVYIGTCSNGFLIYDYKTFKQWKEGNLIVDKSDEIIIENQYTDGRVRVKLNGDMIGFDSQPFVENGRTFVPMRKIFEKLGATIEWDDPAQTVTAIKGNDVIKLTIGSNVAIVNGQEKTLDAPAQLKESRTLVPLRFVSESLGLKVGWSESNNLVIINKAD